MEILIGFIVFISLWIGLAAFFLHRARATIERNARMDLAQMKKLPQ